MHIYDTIRNCNISNNIRRSYHDLRPITCADHDVIELNLLLYLVEGIKGAQKV